MNKGVYIFLGLVVVAGGAYYIVTHPPVSKQRAYLVQITASESSSPKFLSMSDDEIKIAYKYLTQYALKNKQVPQTDPLYNQVLSLSNKYNIFN